MSYLNQLKNATNYTLTENSAVSYVSTGNAVYDLFSLGAAYRSRSDEDCIYLFKKAYQEDPTYALKCLFWCRDARGGAGERRFFRVVARWLASYDTEVMKRNLQYVPEFGRWDDLYVFVDTPLEDAVFNLIKEQLALDIQCKTPSLLAKWLKSTNASSKETKELGERTRKYLGMTQRQYRKTLSVLRERINVLERLMSAGKWDEIEFDKIPSKAGFIYRNAFARRDIIKVKYEAFIKSDDTKVNADTLFPYEVVRKARELMCDYRTVSMDNIDRLAINKYWENQKNFFDGASLNALAVVDTSGSMTWSGGLPIDVATSLGIYCAERAKGPFAGYYVSFSNRPQLIKVDGVDFCDKVKRIVDTNLCRSTNLEGTFDLLLDTAVRNNTPQEELPGSLIIISDMEFNEATGYQHESSVGHMTTLMDHIRAKWTRAGYQMPNLIFWNVNARHDLIADAAPGTTFVSGASPAIFRQVLTGKTGIDLMYEALDSKRYEVIK